MLENKIIFQTTEPFFSDKSIRPEPAKIFIPDWYKNLQSYQGETSAITLKMCMPFLDTLTSGYILKIRMRLIIDKYEGQPYPIYFRLKISMQNEHEWQEIERNKV